MAKKVQVVLDDVSYRLLNTLARPRAGNKSFVVREALRYFGDRESVERMLDGILAQRHTRETMDAGLAAQGEGRFVSHERMIRGGRRRARTR